ncbi:DNA-binding domain-containing protein [Litoribacillus peritrichatus]|uniref:DNA-binding domain-containing protein n=1 Tax=Litoribacillus peritrichatus TaxID=718191 RepID=A0ABP7MF68_9GAMM
MKLEELQNQFQSQLLAQNCQDADWISASSRGLTAEFRLSIYQNAYRVRLAETLLDTFEHTANYITEELFETLAYAYIEGHPSTNTNIGMYGQHFPDYLKQELPSCQEVFEVAMMDWLLRRAFDGADSPALTKPVLEEIVASGRGISHLKLVPTVCLTTQKWNSLDIWHAVNLDKEASTATKLREPMTVMVWRKETSPHFRSLSHIETKAVELLQSGQSIESLCEILSEQFPDLDIATEFGALLVRWLDDEILSSNVD